MSIRMRRFVLLLAMCLPALLYSQTDSLSVFSDSLRAVPQFLWTVRSLNHSDLSGLPFREVDRYLPLLPGMVGVNGGLYVRGSRNGETGYLLDGMSVFNPWLNSDGVPLIPEAIEGIDAHTGAYGAALGSPGGGMVNMKMKTGGERLQYSFNIQTDDFGPPGSFFGIGSFKAVNYGYRNIVGTISGPLPYTPIRFFLAGQSNYMRSRQPMFFTPFRYDNLVTDNLGARPSGIPLPGPLEFRENYIGTSWINTTTLQGNATANVFGIDLKLIGSYDDREFTEGSQWPEVLRNYYRQKRDMLTRRVTKYLNLQAHYAPSDNLDLNLGLSYYNRFARTYDPDFKNNWRLYSDSLANAQAGYLGFPARYTGPYPYSTIYAFYFNDPSSPNGSYSTPAYSKESQGSFAFDVSMKWKPAERWIVRAGGRLESWTMRLWKIQNILNLNWYMDTDRNGVWDRVFSSPLERRVYMTRQGGITAIGFQYDNPGKTTDDGPEGPGRPDRSSAFIEASYTSNDLRFVLGGRYERFDPKFTSVPPILNPVTQQYDWQYPPMDNTLDILKENELVPSEPSNYFLPRVALSVPLTNDLEFHLAYGKYAQMNALNKLYISNIVLSGLLSPLDRVPYNLGGTPVTFTARPEQSTHYEAGFTEVFSPRARVNLSFYQKTLNNQLQLDRIYNSAGNAISVGLFNNGRGVSTGVEASLDATPLRRLHLLVSYAYSESDGRFSDATSNWRYVSDAQLPSGPDFLIPLAYDQTHRGSAIASLTFLEDDGPVLDGLGLDLVFTMHSGQRYTQLLGPQYLGSAGPWNIGVRQLMDWRNYEPLAPENGSTTPWYYNVDLQLRKQFSIEPIRAELSISVLNLFNRKHILNVYPSTGSPNDDGWLLTSVASNYIALPLYEDFYRAINLENRWAYMSATGNDVYGTPRQIRIGLKVEM